MGYESIGIEIDPQYFDVGRLILGPPAPEYEHFLRSSRSIRFHFPNNLNEQIDVIAGGKHRRSHRASVSATSPPCQEPP